MLECESELKTLYNSGYKLINLNSGLDTFFTVRSKLRCTLERLIVEEPAFSFANSFQLKLWEEVYEKPVKWIQDHLEKSSGKTSSSLHLRRLRSILVAFLDEGSTLFQLLLRVPNVTLFSYHFSIYAAILLRKRERLSVSLNAERSFTLLQDAIVCEPENGYGYFILAQWVKFDGDNLLAIYWALISINTGIPYNSLEFLKELSREIAVSPSFSNSKSDLSRELLQMASHALLSQLTGRSHLKHLDQLSHSQISLENADIKSLKYSCISLWLILGINKQSIVTQVQSCLLAKLFQLHNVFWSVPSIRSVFLAFASNPLYSALFTSNNYKSLEKLNNLAYERLNVLLKSILISNDLDLNNQVYIDYSMLQSFANLQSLGSIIDYFIEQQLYVRVDDEVLLACSYEKTQKTERSMKLLTHRFLSTQLETLEATLDPLHVPWTIPDFPCLLRHFSKIRRSVLARDMRIVVTATVLAELDFDKMRNGQAREIIRFLHERLDINDPCIKIMENGHKNQITALKELTVSYEDCRIVVLDAELYSVLVNDKRIPSTNLFNEL